MNLEELLGKELAEQVTTKLGDKKLMLDDGKTIPKSRFDEVNNQKKELKEEVDKLNGTLAENNKDLEKFKASAGASEELKKQIGEYQEKIKATQSEFGTKLTEKEKEWKERDSNNRKSFTVREKLLMEHADPGYIDMIMKSIDLKTVSESEDGKLIGVDDVVSGAKTSFSKLFGVEKKKGTGMDGGASGEGGEKSTATPEKLEALATKIKTTGGKNEDRIAYMKMKQELSVAKEKEEI